MNKTIKDYLIVLFGASFSRGVAFVNSIMIARFLGTDDFGKFSIFFIVMVLTWMFPQAFDSVYVRYAKFAVNKDDKHSFFKAALFLKIIYGVVALVAAYPLSVFLAKICFKKPEITWFIVGAILSGVFQSFLMTIASIFQEKGRFGIFSFLYSFYTISIFILLLILRLLGDRFNLINVMYVHIVVSVIIGMFSLLVIWKKKIKDSWSIDKALLLNLWHFGKWIFGTTILVFVIQRLDMFFLARYVSFTDVGIYSVAQQIVTMISVMAGSMTNVFLPKICVSVESKEKFKSYCKDAMKIVTVINIFLVLLIIFAKPILVFLFGVRYAEAALVTQILLFGWIFYIISIPLSVVYYAVNQPMMRFVVELVRFVVAVIGLLVLLPMKGMVGAAWAMTLSFIIGFIFTIFTFRNKLVL